MQDSKNGSNMRARVRIDLMLALRRENECLSNECFSVEKQIQLM